MKLQRVQDIVIAVVKPSKNVARSKLFGNDSHISELYKMKKEVADWSETTVPIYGTPALHPQTCSRISNLQSGITASRFAIRSIPKLLNCILCEWASTNKLE